MQNIPQIAQSPAPVPALTQQNLHPAHTEDYMSLRLSEIVMWSSARSGLLQLARAYELKIAICGLARTNLLSYKHTERLFT